MRTLTPIDRLLAAADLGLRTIWGRHRANRPLPQTESGTAPATELDEAQRRLSGALMRVNHVGEVCAQALYQAQGLVTRNPDLRAQFEAAARDETDHLAWTEERLQQLGARPSLLNPLWYTGAFAIGLAAGRMGERASLGFVIETERQVERHLNSHLDRLPPDDTASRAIVTQMRDDEVRHAQNAEQAGGVPPPAPVQALMRAAAQVMTRTAHHV
jgi:ubiquinone biosynthesis monooxygenase Coq7